MTLVICVFHNNDLLVSLCYMEQERVTAQILSDSLSYCPLGPKLSPRYLPSFNWYARKLRRNYHSAIFFLVGMAAKADNEEVHEYSWDPWVELWPMILHEWHWVHFKRLVYRSVLEAVESSIIVCFTKRNKMCQKTCE